MASEGRNDVTPYWRTLRAGGMLNAKYPGGVERQADILKSEGHTIDLDLHGRPKRVRDFESKLVER